MNIELNTQLTPMDNELQRLKAIAVLEKAKKLDSQKIGYKFVKINDYTRVLKKV